jgi:uncharacterized FAD-dependent dehydrogenase
MKEEKIVIVGSGVAGINAATKLVDNGYPGHLITIIDKGKDPYNRKPEEVMEGFAGAGGFSDGKLTFHTSIGGQLSKYCGEDKAYDLMDQTIEIWKRFHPDPSKMMYSDPQSEPDFIKPYFDLKLFPVYHIGTDYLHEIGKTWYQYLVNAGVKFLWSVEVTSIDFKNNTVSGKSVYSGFSYNRSYDKLIFAVGKSGIDFAQQLSNQYNLPTEPKSVQIGVRFEAPQKYFQKLIEISYDFKLYQKYDNVSVRSFCTNNNAAYVAPEITYGDVTYNGHAKKGEEHRNDMTNFGILMEIKGIENPFEWSRNVIKKCQVNGKGLYYSPSRKPSLTSEGTEMPCHQIDSLKIFEEIYEDYSPYILNFIGDMQTIFPDIKDDWGMYIGEVKYLSPEPLVNYNNLSLTEYPNVYFAGDALSARGITVAGSQGLYIAESIIKEVNT